MIVSWDLFLFKIASTSSSRVQNNFTTEEVIMATADVDSENEDFVTNSEEESSDESSGVQSTDEEEVLPTSVVKICITREGKVNQPVVSRKERKEQQRVMKKLELERRLKQPDGTPNIPEFTAESKIHVAFYLRIQHL